MYSGQSSPTFKQQSRRVAIMAFRDLLAGVVKVDEPISVNHGMLNHSESINHKAVVFNKITEADGLRSAVNVLARDRLCEIFDVSPGELIDILAWAMANPSEPHLVDLALIWVSLFNNSTIRPKKLAECRFL